MVSRLLVFVLLHHVCLALDAEEQDSLRAVLKALGYEDIEGCVAECDAKDECCEDSVTIVDAHVEGIYLQEQNLSGEVHGKICAFKKLRFLYLHDNNLYGDIPPFASLTSLKTLDLSQNRFTGKIPRMPSGLRELRLSNNFLEGEIPQHLSELKELEDLTLAGNGLQGEIPANLRSQRLSLARNNLTGPIRKEMCHERLSGLFLSNNKLVGKIPQELLECPSIKRLDLANNKLNGTVQTTLPKLMQELRLNNNNLSGEIPAELMQAPELTLLRLDCNNFSGSVRALTLPKVKTLDMSENHLEGEVPSELIDLKELEYLSLSNNEFKGKLPNLSNLMNLRKVSLGHNKFNGEFPESFCKMQKLFSLQLRNNKFGDRLPECISEMQSLVHLLLSGNRFEGRVPSLSNLSRLTVLTLDSNRFSGPMPDLPVAKLAVVTLHDNSFSGEVKSLRLHSECVDNANFDFFGRSCVKVGNEIHEWGHRCCEDLMATYKVDIEQLLVNCPQTCNFSKSLTCDKHGLKPKITLHGNHFCGILPETISEDDSVVVATALMGNMFGNGTEMMVHWLRNEAMQQFLFFSPNTYWSEKWIAGEFLVLCIVFLEIVLCSPFWRRLRLAVEEERDKEAMGVASSYRQTMLMATCSIAFCCVTLPAFILGSNFYPRYGQYLPRASAAYLQEAWLEVVIIVLWCLWSGFFRIAISTWPVPDWSESRDFGRRKTFTAQIQVSRSPTRVATFLLLWLVVVLTVSGPAIFFSMAEAVPHHSIYDLTLKICHEGAPRIGLLVDLLLAGKLVQWFSSKTGLRPTTLFIFMHLCSQWFLPMMATMILHENCAGGWKTLWDVCDRRSSRHKLFDWMVFDTKVLTTAEICRTPPWRFLDGSCSRSLLETSSRFVLEKLFLKATIQPVLLGTIWLVMRRKGCWQHTAAQEADGGQHCKCCSWSGFKSLATKTILSVSQHAQLNTWLEVILTLGPLVPLVSVMASACVATNFVLFHLAMSMDVKVKEDKDDMNNSLAGLSLGHLRLSLMAGWFFQLWHAYSTRMFGRSLLFAMAWILLPEKVLKKVPKVELFQKWMRQFWKLAKQAKSPKHEAVESADGPSFILQMSEMNRPLAEPAQASEIGQTTRAVRFTFRKHLPTKCRVGVSCVLSERAFATNGCFPF
ncbi:unnamed protein product [Durusdinium trenchii]|uniref:Uncharacterized protein n=2 Tax=Durusdinium trenchii TaxID=1381693 RepID=A0ABP0IEJ1_9DINO